MDVKLEKKRLSHNKKEAAFFHLMISHIIF
jgi:hypothetical protein